VSITLTDWQVARVISEASGGTGVTALLAGLNNPQTLRSSVLALLDEERYSRSILRALLVLGAFPADGSERELTDLARQIDLSPSTTHRYIATWTALGCLKQEPRSRRYSRPPPDPQPASGRQR
jgi:hypothetical protein